MFQGEAVLKAEIIWCLDVVHSKYSFRSSENKSNQVPEGSLFDKSVKFVHGTMACNFLSKKIKRWFNDNSGKVEKEFAIRFRGKESFHFMQTFPMLILMIFESGVNSESKLRLVQINHQSVLIRKLLSFCVRISNFNSDNLKEMGIVARSLFKLSCLRDNRLSPSLWTLCNVTPHHASVCLQQYNLGLGCNTMEGREQKHQAISRYAENTTFQKFFGMNLSSSSILERMDLIK